VPASPAISVVIPSRRGARLLRTLEALAAQSVGAGPFEVLVVRDSLSEDLPGAVPEGLAVRFLETPSESGPAGKRNVGWREAQGRLVVFTDDDCEPTEGWLGALAAAAERDPDAVLQGPTLPNPREADALGPFTRTMDVRSLGPWFPTCNIAYPRDVLDRLDGFDEAFTMVAGNPTYVAEDTDLAWRALKAGIRFTWVDHAIVHHAVADLGPSGRLRLAAGWAPIFRIFKRHPELRRRLPLGRFWKYSHWHLSMAAIGVGAGRRFPPALLLAAPYAWGLRVRMTAERARARHVPYYVANDALEMVSAARGSVAARTLVL
jgi:GT2 family glycosyltransferase